MKLNSMIVTENATGEVFRAYFQNDRSGKNFAESLNSLGVMVMCDSYGYVSLGKYVDVRNASENEFVRLDEVVLYPAYDGSEIKTTYLTDFKRKYSPVLTVEMASTLNKLTSDFTQDKK